MKNFIIGQYVPGDSVIHRLDPRAKLIAVLIYVLIVFLANNGLTYFFLAVFSIGAVFLSGVPVFYLYRGLRPILWIILFTFVLHVFMTSEGQLLFQWGWIDIYEGGIVRGIYIALRIFFLILVTTLLTLTTPPIDITDGMETLLSPFKRFRLPVHEFALMISISLRFIPTLMEETEKIMKAQTARGTEFSSGLLKERVKAIIPLLVPLFISAFKRAEDLALAMEARGYRGGEGRTRLRLLIWESRDTALMLLLVLLAASLAWFRSY
ncbi:MAG TPA: energy-coupling factor transporter transmembrane protein EcfT [Bacillales bacterium]|nr:energy-coupling factor transporter transmembrane protein EcfT [Bacillales bacterium]